MLLIYQTKCATVEELNKNRIVFLVPRLVDCSATSHYLIKTAIV